VQPRLLKRSVGVTVPPTRYSWKDDHISFALVTEMGDPSSYSEEIATDDHNKVDYNHGTGDIVFR